MTANRDPDRLIRAWLDLMPDEAPDRAIDAVLQATQLTSQVRRPLGPALWRLSPMNRVVYAAAAAVIVVVLAGGILLFKPSANVGAPSSPSPTPGTTPVATLAPESLRSTWLATSGPAGTAFSPSSVLRLVVNANRDRVSVFDGGLEAFISAPVDNPGGGPGEFDLMSTATAGGCQIGDMGRYGFAFASDGVLPESDGTLLGLTLIADDCAARAAMLGRSWAHAIDEDSIGGRGVSTAFAPLFLITLPPASYVASKGSDTMTATSSTPDRTLIVVRNPVGWTNPCAASGRTKRPIDPTISAFAAYMRTLPGFSVKSTALTIAGYPAMRLSIPSVETADCPSNRVNEWTTGDPAVTGSWALTQGETDVVYLVEVKGDLVLLQWLGAGVNSAEEQNLFATIRFADALPQ